MAGVRGATVVVEIVGGGSGQDAMAKLAQAPADGSIFDGTTPTYINTSLLSDLETDCTDLEGVVGVLQVPRTVLVRADGPFQSLSDLVETAKADPGAVLPAVQPRDDAAVVVRRRAVDGDRVAQGGVARAVGPVVEPVPEHCAPVVGGAPDEDVPRRGAPGPRQPVEVGPEPA